MSMGISLRWYRPRLYRKTALAVISAICVAAAFGRYAKKAPSNKGPRALGVLEVAANGKAHLIAVTIMIDGKFYDAGAYKADPIPMALQGETVYEAVKTGVPQGLFTVGGAMHAKEGFIADGKWRSTAQLESDKAKPKPTQRRKRRLRQKLNRVRRNSSAVAQLVTTTHRPLRLQRLPLRKRRRQPRRQETRRQPTSLLQRHLLKMIRTGLC